MLYCDKCRNRWDWPEHDAGPVENCDVCGERGKCYQQRAVDLPLPDRVRATVLTKKEMPKEWSDCMQVGAAIAKEIMDTVAELSEMQKTAKKHTEYIQLINKLYYGGEL